MKKCTSETGRHNWEHIANFTNTYINGSTARISLKGHYQCRHCGMKKIGNSQ